MDDEPLFLESTVELLRSAGFECDPAVSRDQALQLISRQPFEVVVLDLVLDGEPQLELLRELSASPDSPVVVLVTGHPSIESAVCAVDLRVVGYFLKPFEIGALIERLEEGIRQRRLARLLKETETSLRKVSGTLASLARVFETGGPKVRFLASERHDPEVVEQLETLSRRERDLIEELLHGYRVSTVARRLGISENTVRRHLKSIFLKLEVGSQAELLEKLKP